MNLQSLLNHFSDRPEIRDRILELSVANYGSRELADNHCGYDNDSLKDILRGAFVWSCTEEGADYWIELYDSLP